MQISDIKPSITFSTTIKAKDKSKNKEQEQEQAMPNQVLESLADNISDSNSRMENDFDTSQLLNSSFFSSESVDVIDHSRSFRNSLVLREMSDFNLSASLDQDPNKSVPNNITQNTSVSPPSTPDSMPRKNPFKVKKNETRTVNMSTSPSLSALSDLLNEKSKNAERKMKSSLQNDSSILEEDENEPERSTNTNSNIKNSIHNSNITLSPNLIDLSDEDNSTQPSGHVFVPSSNAGTRSNISIEQPDFLTTPKVEQQPLNNSTTSNEPYHEPIQEVEEEEYEEGSENNISVDISASSNNLEVESQRPDLTEHNSQIPVARQESGLDDDNVTLIGEAERHPQRSTSSNWTRVLENHGSSNSRNNNNTNTVTNSLLGAGNTVLPRTTQPPIPPKQTSKKSIPKGKPVIQSKSDLKSEKQKKRRSLFSFFQKKPSKDKAEPNSMVRSSSLHADVNLSTKPTPEKVRSTSSTLDKKTPTPIEKKSHGSNNLFNNFRKNSSQTQISIFDESKKFKQDVDSEIENKSNSEEELDKPVQLQAPLQLPKQRTKQEHDITNATQRKATPLDFETALNTDSTEETKTLSLEKLTATEQLASELQPPRFLSPRASDDGSKRDSGEVYFPKLLDNDEIDYITQIERNRSIRSNSRRRSTDTLSIKAQNDGMTVFEASDVILATPDLTKSPASSILKNMGTFEASDIDQAFALGSIEERLNELSMSYDEIPNNLIEFNDDKVLAVPNNNMRSKSNSYQDEMEDNDDNDDNDLMNDIMEFANIIDFGDGINLDLDINANNNSTDDYQSKTFNPKVMKANNLNKSNVLQNAPAIDTLQNSGLGLQFTEYNSNEEYPTTLDTPITVETEQFEDEPFDETEFNPIQEQQATPNPTTSPHMEEYLNHTFSNMERPLSMSFNGLMGKAMKNSVSSFNVDQLNPDQRVKFSSKIILYETYDEFEYDRHPDVSTCSLLTPQLAQMIKAELNELKTEMEVHEDSRCYTQFF